MSWWYVDCSAHHVFIRSIFSLESPAITTRSAMFYIKYMVEKYGKIFGFNPSYKGKTRSRSLAKAIVLAYFLKRIRETYIHKPNWPNGVILRNISLWNLPIWPDNYNFQSNGAKYSIVNWSIKIYLVKHFQSVKLKFNSAIFCL